MRLLHIGDLHIGRRLNDIPLLDDQKDVLNQITQIAVESEADAVMIAGDIYDKSMPGADAMKVFDGFVAGLAEKEIQVFMISGNHDSSERISYFSDIISKSGIFTSELFDGRLQTITAADQFGKLNIHLLPFIRPVVVRRFYPDAEITSYEDAVKVVLENSPVNTDERNILIGHQFIIGGEVSDSEDKAVGGLDSISSSVFNEFDYVALGHLHKPQRIGRDTLRYSGSPLKYSISESNHKKSVTLVDMGAKGDEISIRLIPLTMPHDVREVKGTLEEIMDMPYSEDYVSVIFTDEMVAPDARITAGTVFPNMISAGVQNSRTAGTEEISISEDINDKSKLELFCDFYKMQNNGIDPEPDQLNIMEEILKELEDEGYETN